jgi:hypothetical protein
MTDLDGEDMVCQEPWLHDQDVPDAALAKAGVE